LFGKWHTEAFQTIEAKENLPLSAIVAAQHDRKYLNTKPSESATFVIICYLFTRTKSYHKIFKK